MYQHTNYFNLIYFNLATQFELKTESNNVLHYTVKFTLENRCNQSVSASYLLQTHVIISTVVAERVLLIVTKLLALVLLVMSYLTVNVKISMSAPKDHVTVRPYARIILEALRKYSLFFIFSITINYINIL